MVSSDLDTGLTDAVVELAGHSVPVALAGFAEATEAAKRLPRLESGWVVVTDEDKAIAVTEDWAGVVWEAPNGTPFVRWWFDRLWLQGIGPSLVAIVAGDPASRVPATITGRPTLIPLPAGRSRNLSAVLNRLVQGREEGELPGIDESRGWTLTFEIDADERPDPSVVSLLTLSNGSIGVRGGLEDRVDDDHFVMAAGAFGRGPEGLVRPLPGGAPTVLSDSGNKVERFRRIIDLRTGVVARQGTQGELRTVRFASLTHPDIVALRAQDGAAGTPWPRPSGPPRVASATAADHTSVVDPDRADATVTETASDRAVVITAAEQRHRVLDDGRRIDRLAAIRADTLARRQACRTEATSALGSARRAGFDRLLSEHRRAWARRWTTADVEIDGDPDNQIAVRFALFHLLSCAPTTGEAVVGARGLTGLAYAGHVFWDTDVYVLPALAATIPTGARAVLQYRIARLDAARKRALERGLAGARYPWESADTGEEVTPPSVRDLEGREIPVITGEHAEHINADIVWALHHYIQWTGDWSILSSGGLDVVLETARYWPGRMRTDEYGRAHLDGVIGPDEYHELVDDNAFTNNLARWHLRWAAELGASQGRTTEAVSFREAADALVDGYEPTTGRHEQFAGFDELEPVMIGDIARPPVAADVLLGRPRVQATQIIKQPDALMLHHMLPDRCPPGSLRADVDHYLPRTAHGSSLSPAICASVLARDGRPDEALALFDVAARLDLDDLTRTSAGGLHLATMGGLWQAVVHGFGGIMPSTAGLIIDPCLPQRWERLSVRIRYRDQPLHITIDDENIVVDSPAVVPVIVGGKRLLTPCRSARPRRTDR